MGAAGAGYPGFTLNVVLAADGTFLRGLTRVPSGRAVISPDGRLLCAGQLMAGPAAGACPFDRSYPFTRRAFRDFWLRA